jgi:hypothetical protein
VGNLNRGLPGDGGTARSEQPRVDKPLDKSLVIAVPLREPGRPTEVPGAVRRALGTCLGGLGGDETEQDTLQPWLVSRAEFLPQLLGPPDERSLRARQLRPVRELGPQAPVGLLGKESVRGVPFP